jgi:hypothetical protein
MPYDMSDEERMDEMFRYSIALNSDLGYMLATSESANDAAEFISIFGREQVVRFTNDMVQILGPNIRVSNREDVREVANELSEMSLE